MRARGFTIIEFLVAIALAGMVVAGALQMHVSFNVQSTRQQEVTEIHQRLRVAMMIVGKAIRNAGAGIKHCDAAGVCTPMMFKELNDIGSCGVGQINHFAFEWSNSNAWKDPILPAWTVGTPDTDPDWFRSVWVNSHGRMVSVNNNGANLEIFEGDPTGMRDGDLFQVIVNGKICIREVSAAGVHGGALGDRYIQHNPSSSTRCFNPQPSNEVECVDKCVTNKCIVKHISGGGTVFRILDPNGVTPRLAMRVAPFAVAENDVNYPWMVLAENIEDMQLALKMKDGRVCHDRDDPLVCNPSQAVAVRVTLVGRSTRPLQGVERGVKGGYEDRVVEVVKDGYLRRALSSEIHLRNNNL